MVVLSHEQQEAGPEVQRFRDSASDGLSGALATWSFLIGLTGLIAGSILWNTVGPKRLQYDPYPFILLNLFMSALAALTAPILLMSANRQAARDRETLESANQASERDLAVDAQSYDLIKKIAEKMEIE